MVNRIINSRPYLTTRSLVPENLESPVHFLQPGLPFGNNLFFRRNHFAYPAFDSGFYTLTVTGEVARPATFHYRDLVQFPTKTIRALLECSGNKRAFFKEKTFGEQWENGAWSEGIWRGIPLKSLLDYCNVSPEASEVIFRGRDSGIKNRAHTFFERSLPMKKASADEVIIAFEYNGKPLTYKHGFPFRLIVPGWYGMASVKWLSEIKVAKSSFEGPFQTDDYVYYYEDGKTEPVTENKVNSTILQPLDRQILQPGIHLIIGTAWSGDAVIERVDISLDNGKTWNQAQLAAQPQKYQPVGWFFQHDFQSGREYQIQARAVDSSGATQPEEGVWNKKGYGYNGIMKVSVKVE